MNTLVLSTRLNVLKKGLKQATNILTDLKRRRQLLDDLVSRMMGNSDSISYLANEAERMLHRCVERLRNATDDISVGNTPLEGLEEAERELEEIITKKLGPLRTQANSAKQDIESLRAPLNCVALDEAAGPVATAQSQIRAQANECLKALGQIETDLLKPAEVQGNTTEAQKLLEQAWAEYAGGLNKRTDRVYAEYVDFLGGLALRDTGFDQKACQIADELIRKFDRFDDARWGSLTIPALHAAVSTELARIIRLGYPEWSIWALPLTAHEFGHLVVQKCETVKLFIDKQNGAYYSRCHLETLLADAFATYTMGPAYACAAMLLRFNPALAFNEEVEIPPVATRGKVIFSMLNWVDEQSAANKPYAGIIGVISDAWLAALQQANPLRVIEDIPNAVIKSAVSFLGEFLKRDIDLKPPTYESVQVWPDLLLKPYDEKIDVYGTEELRDVLNAAWVCRIGGKEDREEEIAKAALCLWDSIVSTKKRLGKPSRKGIPGADKR